MKADNRKYLKIRTKSKKCGACGAENPNARLKCQACEELFPVKKGPSTGKLSAKTIENFHRQVDIIRFKLKEDPR